jgi:hypothetical protein
MLLETDPILPSVGGIVAGEPIRGSWWSHRAGRPIYRVLSDLLEETESADSEALVARLVAGKITFVHRRLWPSFLALAACGEPWQVGGLDAGARALLSHVRASGSARADRLPRTLRLSTKQAGDAARTLDRRLLLRTWSEHTESGSHAIACEPWDAWARRSAAPPAIGGIDAVARAKQEIETILAAWTGTATASRVRRRPAGLLPWRP